MFVVDPELGEDELEALLQRVKNYMNETAGTITKTENWGVRKLAYMINNRREGRYYLMNFTMESGQVKAFERNLLLVEGLMRELIVRLGDADPIEKSAPPMPEEGESTQTSDAEDEADTESDN